jgi:catalase
LNKNPENYFAEVEQAAFSPSHMVPGIDASADRMLQGRLFSYPDTHRHRLGVNYKQIPINRPKSQVNTYQRDGAMSVLGNGGSGANYGPNSENGPAQNNVVGSTFAPEEIEGLIGRFSYEVTDDDFVQAGNLFRLMDDDFVQAGNLFRLMDEENKNDLANNIAADFVKVKQEIIDRQLAHFERADPNYRRRVEVALTKLKK